MYAMEQLASERTRGNREMAERLRHSRRQRALRRARRIEQKAERRMIQAWRHAAELRTRLESLDY
ncbi:MAG: hypothetical protein ACRDOA_08700 [Streptosporangiaceae bacterium]